MVGESNGQWWNVAENHKLRHKYIDAVCIYTVAAIVKFRL